MKIGQFLLTILCFLFVTTIQAQTNYYVSPTGNNNSIGTSETTAWQTIQHAADNATPNSVVNIMAGTYNELVSINISGTLGNPVTFKNYQNDIVVISGIGFTAAHSRLISIFDHSNITIDGLVLEGLAASDACGILVADYGGITENISIRNLKVRNIGYDGNDQAHGIQVFGAGATTSSAIRNVKIEYCEVYNNRNGGSENITVNGNVDTFYILNNSIHDNTNIGIDAAGNYVVSSNPVLDHARNGIISGNITFNNIAPTPYNAGIDCDGCWKTIIERNKSYNNPVGIAVACEKNGNTDSIIVRNNLVFQNTWTGIAIGGSDASTTGFVENSTVSNNTCYHNNPDNLSGEIRISKTNNCQFFHNIMNSDGDLLFYIDKIMPQNFTSNYNEFYSTQADSSVARVNYQWNTQLHYSAYKNTTGKDANSFFLNPQFVNSNLSSLDLHLQNTSPAINSGNLTFVPASTEKDIDGDNRANGIVDIGADEYYGVSLPLNSLSFTVACDNQKSKLNWSMYSEINNDYFAIEKSLNGNDWKQIASIKSQGSSSNTHNYSYNDAEKINNVSYYRLKQFNLDGKFSYSEIVLIKSCTENLYVFTLSPNPASENIFIKLHGVIEKQQAQIFNVLGGVVKEVEFSGTRQINITDLPKGVYFIKLKNYPTQAQKFIKE